jgi:hypothetical protein
MHIHAGYLLLVLDQGLFYGATETLRSVLRDSEVIVVIHMNLHLDPPRLTGVLMADDVPLGSDRRAVSGHARLVCPRQLELARELSASPQLLRIFARAATIIPRGA